MTGLLFWLPQNISAIAPRIRRRIHVGGRVRNVCRFSSGVDWFCGAFDSVTPSSFPSLVDCQEIFLIICAIWRQRPTSCLQWIGDCKPSKFFFRCEPTSSKRFAYSTTFLITQITSQLLSRSHMDCFPHDRRSRMVAHPTASSGPRVLGVRSVDALVSTSAHCRLLCAGHVLAKSYGKGEGPLAKLSEFVFKYHS